MKNQNVFAPCAYSAPNYYLSMTNNMWVTLILFLILCFLSFLSLPLICWNGEILSVN